jgi:acetate kinase
MTPAALNELVNRQAGLLGVSWTSADIRDLLERESTDGHAAEAVGLFCYQAKKYFGALAAALGGLDTLAFTGGIGEHAVSVRLRICEGLEFLGIGLSPRRNEAHAPVISRKGSSVTVRVMQTDEDLMIARHTRELVVGVGAPEGNGAASSPATNQHPRRRTLWQPSIRTACRICTATGRRPIT